MADEPKKVRGVYEHPKDSGIWWIQYFDYRTSPPRHRERVGRRSDAIKLVAIRKAAIHRGEKLPELQKRRVTVGDLIDIGIAYARENNESVRDYVCKGELLRKALGTRGAEDLTPDEIAEFTRKRNIAPATCNRYRSFLSLCYREGMRREMVDVNPAKMLRQKREPHGRTRFLSRDEYELVIATLREKLPGKAAAVIVSVQTGARLMEQHRLRWAQVDMERRLITFLKTKNGERRTVPMTSVVYEELLQLRPQRPAATALVFPRPRGGKKAVQPRWYEKVLRGLEIEDYTWHSNRHTFCSWLAMAGVPLKTIQELAGHKTISITAKYAHLSPDHKGAEIEKLVGLGKPKLLEIRSATGTATGGGRR